MAEHGLFTNSSNEVPGDALLATYCAVHHAEKAVLYCAECNTDQFACLRCIGLHGRHTNHRVVSLEIAYKNAASEYTVLLDSVEDGRKKAKESLVQNGSFEERMVREVMKSARRMNNEIDKLVRDLEEVRVALHTAVQRVAQTLRSPTTKREQVVENVKSPRKAAQCASELRRLLSCGTLSELVQRKSESEKTCRRLTKALDAQVWKLGEAQLDLSIEKRFIESVETLNGSMRALRELTAELVARSAPAKQVSLRLSAM